MKKIYPTEYEEAKAFTEYLDLKGLLFTHIAQETFTRNWGTKMKNKLMGVRRGFPDYVVCTPRYLLFIELKRIRGGQISPEQRIWIDKLNEYDCYANVCYGAEEAIKFVENYLN